MTFSCQTILLSLTTEQQGQLELVDKRIENHKQDLQEHQKQYDVWSQKKADIICEWAVLDQNSDAGLGISTCIRGIECKI